MKKAVFVDGLRTPFFKAGSVPGLTATHLAAFGAAKPLLKKYPDLKTAIDFAVCGNINKSLPPDGGNIGRLIVLNAGLPVETPAYTVDINCASGLHAAVEATNLVERGKAKCVLVVGVEAMSDYGARYSREQQAVWGKLLMATKSKKPMWAKLPKQLQLLGKIKMMPHKPIWVLQAGLTDPYCKMRMDSIGDAIANDWGISRKELDLFGLESQRKAAVAQQSGRLAQEIVPLGKYNDDNGIRADTQLAKLARLKPTWKGGVCTAGNSSQISDGAVALIVAEEEFARSMGWPVRAEMALDNAAVGACAPERMGLGPVAAIKKVLDQTGLKLSDIDLIESNEAFASVVIGQSMALSSKRYCSRFGLGESIGEYVWEKTNVNGGAIALGHPLGASGARLLLTMVKELEVRDKDLGLVTLCIGGGQGEALIVKRTK